MIDIIDMIYSLWPAASVAAFLLITWAGLSKGLPTASQLLRDRVGDNTNFDLKTATPADIAAATAWFLLICIVAFAGAVGAGLATPLVVLFGLCWGITRAVKGFKYEGWGESIARVVARKKAVSLEKEAGE